MANDSPPRVLFGESAVFFDTPQEMMDRITDLLAEAPAAARARYVLKSMGLAVPPGG